MFSNTPDEHFLLDRHPDHPQVILASPCSGDGYKFCSVIGEILADLAIGDGTTRHRLFPHEPPSAADSGGHSVIAGLPSIAAFLLVAQADRPARTSDCPL